MLNSLRAFGGCKRKWIHQQQRSNDTITATTICTFFSYMSEPASFIVYIHCNESCNSSLCISTVAISSSSSCERLQSHAKTQGGFANINFCQMPQTLQPKEPFTGLLWLRWVGRTCHDRSDQSSKPCWPATEIVNETYIALPLSIYILFSLSLSHIYEHIHT